ncbi:MAG: galactokinase [Polyangiaceae bacterium]
MESQSLYDRSSLRALTAATARAFEERFGMPTRWLVAAPGRVNLIGEHTDYNGGFVLPMAIGRYTVIAAAPAASRYPRRMTFESAMTKSSVEVELDEPQRRGEPTWSNYVRGVAAGFERRGASLPGLCALVRSDLPVGAGLSSSAALEVGVATLLEFGTGMVLDPVDKARLCQTAEHEFAGVPCGLMDQLACVLAEEEGPLLIDCRSEECRTVPLTDPAVSVLVANSNVRHSLDDGAYARRRAECERAAEGLGVATLRDATPEMVDGAREVLGPVLFRRARHVVTENDRTLAAARALDAGAVREAGLLFYESHSSLRDDFEVSCAELDVLVDVARDLGEPGGVYGSRMTGGGFGGCTVTLVRSEQVEAVSEKLRREYERRCGRTLDTFVSRPVRGVRALEAKDWV